MATGNRTIEPAYIAEVVRLRELDGGQSWSEVARAIGPRADGTYSTLQVLQQTYAKHYRKQGLEPPVWGPVPPRAQTLHYGQSSPQRAAVGPQGATVADGPAEPTAGAVAQVVTIRAEARAGWTQSVLVTSDHHFDHIDCDRSLLRHHLTQAAERGAGVLVLGDLFCAMQGKMDRRASKPELRPEYLVPGYMDAIVEDAVNWYAPFAPHLWLLTYGNHETKVTSYQETDILKRFWRELTRQPGGGGVLLGSYAGWLSMDCVMEGRPTQRVRLRYHHGWGGGGPVTLGVIGTNRQAAAADFDVYAQGHIHESWSVARMRETVGPDGGAVVRRVPYICAGTYKNEGTRGIGWHIETGKPPKPLGGYWLHLYWSERQQAILSRTEEVEL